MRRLTVIISAGVHLVFAPVFELPQSETGEFDLESTVHQTRAGPQVPVELQVAFVNELHPLKHKPTGSNQELNKNKSCCVNEVTHVDDVVSERQFKHPVQLDV